MKQDGRRNNGGNKNAGRKPKADELKKIELMDSIATPREAWEKVWRLVEQDDMQAVRVWIEHRFGKPKEQKEVNLTSFSIDPIEWINEAE